MDQQAYEAAKAAYQHGDWASVVTYISQGKLTGELYGAADHLLGNALMKLGRYPEAVDAYSMALADSSYGKVGALNTNLGRALMAAGRLGDAVQALQTAIQDNTYTTPYKAQMALGSAQLSLGNIREAGIAFRNAAIDESNPNPADALVKLGGTFMKLGRPVDAIEAYRTALDFSTPLANQGSIYADLGSAYVAANRMSEAVDAYSRASSDGAYSLTPDQQASYSAAQKAIAAMASRQPSDTDAFLEAAGYGTGTGSFDPLDPLGESGEIMPSPEDTGFFSVTESDLINAEKNARKKHHPVRNFFIFLLILVIIGGGVGGYFYYKGYGYPTQDMVVQDLFSAASSGDDISSYLAASVSDDAKSEIQSAIVATSSVKIDGIDRSMTSSTVHAVATLTDGATQAYIIEMSRDIIGWKVTSVSFDFSSLTDSSTTTGSTTGTLSTDTTAATTESSTDAEQGTSTSTDTSSEAATIAATE